MSPYLLETKFQPSISNIVEVPRVGLITLLNKTKHYRLRTIHASAGFGKTSLLSQWFAALKAQGMTAAWLSLDADDNHTATFVDYLLSSTGNEAASVLTSKTRPDYFKDHDALIVAPVFYIICASAVVSSRTMSKTTAPPILPPPLLPSCHCTVARRPSLTCWRKPSSSEFKFATIASVACMKL